MSDKNSLFKWYVVRAVSGQENKIKTYIENEISHMGMDSFICLLYTSPSPRDGLLSRMPSSA